MRSAEVIEISSDEERGGKGKVKVEKGEGSVEGKKKGGGEEEVGEIGELQRQLNDQKKESEELRNKLDKVLQSTGGCSGGLAVQAPLLGAPTSQQHVVHGGFHGVGTPFGLGHHHSYPNLYPSFAPQVPPHMPSQYVPPGPSDWSALPPKEGRERKAKEEDEEKGKGFSFSFSCVVS